MRTAIYARKSNDDSDKAATDKSVERQVAHARDYIVRKGWTVDDEHVFVDDGISGAEFKHRPALLKLLDHLAEFDAIVVSEQSRLGREMSQTSAVLAKIAARKVRIFSYLTDQELKFANATDKFMVAAVAFANELERDLASQRSRDAALKRAKEARNFGGRVYGYDNLWLMKDGTRLVTAPGAKKPPEAQTLYAINETEAGVVRAFYQMYADGHGGKVIAMTMNGEPQHRNKLAHYFHGVLPQTPVKGTGSWAPSSLHGMLRNPRYAGKVPFGATRKYVDADAGTKRRERTGNVLLVDAPELRIVPQSLWDAVQKRLGAMRGVYLRSTGGKLHGRPETGRDSRYLLSGLVRCESCGAAMIVSSYWSGRQRKSFYCCSYRSNRGSTICSNSVKPAVAELDAAVLQAIERYALQPAVVNAAVRRAAELVQQQQAERPDSADRLRREVTSARKELDRLVAAIATGRAPESVLAAIAEREARIKAAEMEMARLAAPAAFAELSSARLQRELAAEMERWREALYGDVPLARQVLRKLLSGPVWLEPQQKGYRLRGATRLGPLLPDSVKMASPRGFEPRLPP